MGVSGNVWGAHLEALFSLPRTSSSTDCHVHHSLQLCLHLCQPLSHLTDSLCRRLTHGSMDREAIGNYTTDRHTHTAGRSVVSEVGTH